MNLASGNNVVYVFIFCAVFVMTHVTVKLAIDNIQPRYRVLSAGSGNGFVTAYMNPEKAGTNPLQFILIAKSVLNFKHTGCNNSANISAVFISRYIGARATDTCCEVQRAVSGETQQL